MTARYEDPHYRPQGRWQEPETGQDLHRGWGRFRTYLASLSVEHWLLFLAGLTVGLILG